MNLVLIALPKPTGVTSCYISHFTSVIVREKNGKLLVNAPAGFHHREPMWVPKAWATPIG